MINDLRDWLREAEALGELVRVEGAEEKDEIGGIVDWFQEKVGTPALLFDKIPGYPEGYRIAANTLYSPRRVALSLGLPPDLRPMDLVRASKKIVTEMKLCAPVQAAAAPVLTHVRHDAQVDLMQFPVPRWHELDGGAYIGTGCLVIHQDPDTGWTNVGCYRVQRFDSNLLGIMMTTGRHGDLITRKYWAAGKPAPVAISVGHDPLLLMMAGMQIPAGLCEYDVAGGIRGEPVPVVRLPRTGLTVPAMAEMVLEGEMRPDDTREEGPFGEWTGYYASGIRPLPVIRIHSVYFRDDPILLGAIPRKPPNDDQYFVTFLGSGAIWAELEKAGIEGIKGVWSVEASGSRMMTVVAIEQLFPGHAKQVAMAAAACHSGAYATRYTVVVDEDIDPSNLDEVIWAMCTRVDPREDMDLIHRGWSSPLDPMSYPPELQRFNARVLIDACRPWERRNSFPKVAQASPALRAHVVEKWKHLLA